MVIFTNFKIHVKRQCTSLQSLEVSGRLACRQQSLEHIRNFTKTTTNLAKGNNRPLVLYTSKIHVYHRETTHGHSCSQRVDFLPVVLREGHIGVYSIYGSYV